MKRVALNQPCFHAALLLLSVMLLCGCAAGARMSASADDYQQYRRLRLAETQEDRFSEAWRYLQRGPQGRWYDEVFRWFAEAEPAYFKRHYHDIERLRRYLAAVPEGPHAGQVKARVAELALAGRYREGQAGKALQQARGVQRRLAEVAQQRELFLFQVSEWTRQLASIEAWGGRTHELHHEFIYRYRLQEPAARCSNQRCIKALSFEYGIPVAGQIEPRQALFDVIVQLKDGGVESAELTGPDLFSRVGEALQLRPVRSNHGQARAEAIGHAVQLLSTVLEPSFPQASCAADAVSPEVLHRLCHGVSVRVIAAVEPGQEDRIVVEPIRGAASPPGDAALPASR